MPYSLFIFNVTNMFFKFAFLGIKRKKEENHTLWQQTPTIEGSEEMGKNDELREDYKEWPWIIVREAELISAQRVLRVTFVLDTQLYQWGFELCKQPGLR